jgi:hypothetical protein
MSERKCFVTGVCPHPDAARLTPLTTVVIPLPHPTLRDSLLQKDSYLSHSDGRRSHPRVRRVRPAASRCHYAPPSCARSLTPPSPVRAPIPHYTAPPRAHSASTWPSTLSSATIHSSSTCPTPPPRSHPSRPSTATCPIRTHPWRPHRLLQSAEDTTAGRTRMLQMHVSSVSDILEVCCNCFILML